MLHAWKKGEVNVYGNKWLQKPTVCLGTGILYTTFYLKPLCDMYRLNKNTSTFQGVPIKPWGMVNWHPLGTIWHPLEGPGICMSVYYTLFIQQILWEMPNALHVGQYTFNLNMDGPHWFSY